MNKKWIARTILLLFSLFCVFFTKTPVIATSTQSSPFYWDRIDVNIDVQANGDMLITEEQEYVFNREHTSQRYRYIPLAKVDEIKDVTVEENGQTIGSKTGIENNQLWIRWQHELNPPETRTFIVKYRVVGGLQMRNQAKQVYWKAIFADRKAAIQNAKVKVTLPEALSGKVTKFTHFDTPATSRQIDGRTFEFVASQPIQPQRELEVQITFPTGILNLPEPSLEERSRDFSKSFTQILSQIFWVVPMLGVLIAVIVSQVRSRTCPKCKKLKWKKTHVTLKPATYTSTGLRKTTGHCQNCSHHSVKESVIPVLVRDSGGGGSFGCDGGGGGGGGGDGGGGGGGD
ncbi:MAG: putative membrane protein (DUF2207) [Phormidesmis priestleyi Ana]|uniref:Putative membrane protein (DUF2207) n=1 Tax=Phormidesmis priestleyi Ana TaxID=1666911 RepID=A0A0P7ZQG7_9CYAN|nr:MAG: putative membrane protein (DUF2207) [Phormidesmis priestleyi Ana]